MTLEAFANQYPYGQVLALPQGAQYEALAYGDAAVRADAEAVHHRLDRGQGIAAVTEQCIGGELHIAQIEAAGASAAEPLASYFAAVMAAPGVPLAV